MSYQSKLELIVDSRSGERSLRNFRGELDQTEQTGERTFGNLKRVAMGFSGALATIGAASFARDVIRETDQLDRNMRRTRQLIETTGRTAQRSADSMHQQARAIALATLQSTEGVMQAQQTLLTFRNITGETFDQAIEGAVDLASAMGQDLNSSVLQLGKALEDPVKGLTALSRSGTVFTDEQREMVKQMVETNRTAEAQQFILSELAAQYGGVAAAEAEGLAGAQDTLGQRIQEAKIAMGESLNASENLTDAYAVLAGGVHSLTENMDGVIRTGEVIVTLVGTRMVAALAGATGAKLAATQQAIAYQMALARMAGASGTATAAAGALRGALTLLGGPLGLLIGAGGLMYAFREELGLVKNAAEPTTQRIDDLTDSINKNSVAAVEAGIVNLASEYFVLGQRAASTRAEIEKLTKAQENDARGARQNLQNQMKIADLQGELAQLTTEQEAAGEAADQLRDTLVGLGETAVSETDSLGGLSSQTEINTKTTDEAAQAASGYASELDSLLDRITPNRREAKQYARDLNLLNLALASGGMEAKEYMQAMGMLQESFQTAQRGTEDLADTNTDAADEMSREWERFGNSVDDTFKDAFKGAFDSFDDFADRLKGAFENLLAELAYAAVKNEIKIGLGMGTSGPMSGGISDVGNLFSGGGSGGILDSIGGFFGGGSSSAAAGGLYSNVATGAATGGLYSSAATGAVQGGLYGNVATGGLASSGGLMSGMGSMAAAAGPAVAAYAAMEAASWLDEKFASDAKYRIDAGGLGVGINMISKGLFGGSWEPTGKGGVELGVGGEGVTGRNFAEERKSGGLFSGSSYKDVFSDLDSDFENQLADTYAAQLSAAEGAFMALGEETAGTVLDSFTAGMERIRTDNKSEEEVSQAINTWLSSTLDSAVSGVDGAGAAAQFARSGEGIYDTVIRLGTALQAFNETVVRVKDNALDASYASGDAADSVIQMAGGVESLSTLTDYYFNNILSSEERIQKASDSGARALGRFSAATGEVVNTSEELKALVDGLDLTTDAGQRLYAEALKVAPALQDVEKGLESVSARFQSSIDSMNAAVSSAEGEVQRLYDAFMDQSFSQQTALLELAGDEQAALNLARERELESIDPLLRETQQFIWQLEDEAQAKQEATKAGQDYAREINRVQSQLASTFEGISQWVDQQNATTGTPSTNLAAAGDQFARQLTLAENGDRNALQGITQYADQYLSAGQDMFASGSGFQRIQEDVLSALQDLPDQISAEEYIAEEVKQALREQTQGISTNLGDVLRGDNPSNIAQALANDFSTLAGGIDGVLTPEQLAIVMTGKATDAELKAIMRAVDLNGDGVMDGLESVIIQSLPTDAVLGTVLRNKMNELDKNQLTHAQIRNALSPIATDAEIDRLIREVDVNGDGIISAEELTASRVSGIAGGVAASLSSSFSMLDKNLDDNLTFGELRAGLKGMATDAQIRALIRSTDLSGDGIISQLESVVIKDMPTDVLLETALSNKLDELGTDQLTEAQIRKALSPIATDKEIDRLINLSSKTGSTQISWLKWQDGKLRAINSESRYTNNRLQGLARGIGSSLSPMFKSIDTSLDGLIDYSEFSKAFGGMATDKELRRIFGKLDEDGSGTISRLEALKESGEGTEDNTKSLEQRAYDQLRELNGLVGEMTRTTDQFVGLNSGITSLTESINALGVAQAEVARIERERAAAEKAERERIERERIQAQRQALQGEISSLRQRQSTLASASVSAPSRNVINSNYRHVPDAINNINRTAESILGSSGVTDRSAERLRDYFTKGGGFAQDQGVGDAPGPGGAYSPGGLYWPYVKAYIDKIGDAADARQSAAGLSGQIAELQKRLKGLSAVNGSHADGNWNVGFDGYIAELHKNEMVVPASTANMLRELPGRDLPMPDISAFPLLNRNDQTDAIRDLINENRMLRKELGARLDKIEQHSAAAVQVQQAGFNEQINEQKRGNAALGTMASKARLEGARR